MPVRQQKLEALQFDAGASGNGASNARTPFRESEMMELKSLGSTVDHEGFSVPPASAPAVASASAHDDSDFEDDAHRARLRSIRIRDASESQPVASDNVSVDFLNSNDVRRSARDAWAAPDASGNASKASISIANTFEESDDWSSPGGSPKRVLRVIDVPLCERVVPPKVDAVMTNKIKGFLRAEKIRIWLLPYSDERGDGHVPPELIANYTKRLDADATTLAACLERLRILTFNRKIRRLAEDGITVAHIETEVVEPDRSADNGPPTSAAPPPNGSSTPAARKGAYEQVDIDSHYSLANGGASLASSAPVYAVASVRPTVAVSQEEPQYDVANAVPTRRYEDLVSEYADINPQEEEEEAEARAQAAAAAAAAAVPPPLPQSARPNLPTVTVADENATDLMLPQAEPPLMQFNEFGNQSQLSSGYLELGALPEDASGLPGASAAAAPADQFSLDLGPAEAMYAYDTPSFNDFNDMGSFTLGADQPAPMPLDAFNQPPPPPPSVAVTIPASPAPIFASASLAATDASSGRSSLSAPAPRSRDQRASVIEVSMAAGGDSACEGFVPQLFRPKICSLCFRERSLHKGM